MDASASKRRDAEVDRLFGLYLKIENSSYPSSIKQKKSVIKYTRLPDFDNHSKTTWLPQTYIVEPRLRRIITVEESKSDNRRSLKSDIAIPTKVMASDICKRKIVTIEEDDEYELYPKFSQQLRKSYKNVINKAIETDIKDEKPNSQRKISRLTHGSKSSKDMKPSIKSNIAKSKKEISCTKLDNKYKYSRGDTEIQDYAKNKSVKETSRSARNVISPSKLPLNKKIITSKESDQEVIVKKNKQKEDRLVSKLPPKKTQLERSKSSKSHINLNRSKISFLKDIKEKNKPITIIHVPLDDKLSTRDVATEVSEDILNFSEKRSHKVDSSVQVIDLKFKDMNIGTEVLSNKVHQGTEIDQDFISNYDGNEIKKTFDSLDIPNVTLTNNSKNDLPKEHIVNIINKESPILNNSVNALSEKEEKKDSESCFHKSTSYIISRATVTYTTEQKINFHVVGKNEVLQAHVPSGPYNYPMNVVSVYKKMKNQEYHDDNRKLHYDNDDDNEKSYGDLEHSNGSILVNCSYAFDNDKLVKPSDIISTIKVNNSLLHSDYICEQFQRELNFIDSFFESLQYLESCSLSENCISETKVENWINSSGNEFKHLEFGSFLSKFENEIDIDDSKTMASKSLCLLNLLIRDEQRRAKNLLFVLKMREDALKDFTKSQILWLENKKKQDNTDISTLKKKQRGALLKLQHECGEMQRMRKTLLTLSEKRKLALMKTKKNIEVKLRNSVDVEQIILGKKKLKRCLMSDRNVAPLKCFELSSSGCDDSSTSRPQSNPSVLLSNISKSVTSAEKCVQTGENASETVYVDRSTDTADENFVVVDGGYLNILFHNLSLPQIFSSEKQYEVNKEALNNIVHTSNTHHFNWNNDIVIEELMNQIKNHDLDSHTPSTARSLVDEFDLIYKGLTEDRSHDDGSEHAPSNALIDEIKCTVALTTNAEIEESVQKPWPQLTKEGVISKLTATSSIDEACTCEPLMVSVGTQSSRGKDTVTVSVSGPLPVPAGAAAVPEDIALDVPTCLTEKTSIASSFVDSSSSSSQLLCPSVSSLTSPVQYEAEELRRQELAIEREIKALEQQQCQLLAVREIPDKPPPPYTPPAEPRAPKTPRKFTVDETVEEQISNFIYEPRTSYDDSEANVDPFDVFVKDFCHDSVLKQKLETNEKYWDTCNFPPSKPELNDEKLITKATSDIKEVLTSVPPTVVSGVGARRSDHIDDILFAEWRRCEPEWTSLHADEVIVKNQVFESIFQKILTETVDEYKRTVLERKKMYI